MVREQYRLSALQMGLSGDNQVLVSFSLTDDRRLQKAIVSKAERYQDLIVSGYTHLQRAQPILLAHHLLSYVSMLDRDRERLEDCMDRVNRSPLGAGAR